MRKSTVKTLSSSRVLFLMISFISVFGVAAPVSAADIIIGVGSEAIVHRHAGKAICRAVTKSIQGLTCKTRNVVGRDTAEPLAILNDVHNGSIEIGLVQADWLHHAYARTGPAQFLDADFKGLRVLFTLHDEPFTVVARSDAGIVSLDGLVGKRVNIGYAGSRQRDVMAHVFDVKGWDRSSFQVADELSDTEQTLALCHNRVQAMVMTVSHPDPNIAKAIKLCGAKIVGVSSTDIDKLVSKYPYYSRAEIIKETYADQSNVVMSFGARVAVVGSEDLSDELALEITQAVFDNLENVKNSFPPLRHHSADDMLNFNSVVPMHRGAEGYVKRKRLM